MFTIMELVDYLKTNITFTFYPNQFPAKETNDCAMVVLDGGEVNRNIGTPNFQVLVRANHPSVAEQKAYEVFNLLNYKTNFTIGTTHVVQCVGKVPLYTGEKEEWHIYSINFKTITG